MSTFKEEQAFPASAKHVVYRVIALLARNQMHPPSGGFCVSFDDEVLDIPYRVYYASSDVADAVALGGTDGVIAMCLGTRHHDGFLREECVKSLLHASEPWVVPFVVQLLGEYVLEISQSIEASLLQQDLQPYVAYLRQNMAHLRTLERRAVSYWDVYYRHRFPGWKDFPACKTIAMLRHATERSKQSFEPTPVGGPLLAAQLQR